MHYFIDVLKSVYELRKSHADFVNHPNNQQVKFNRRNIQSAIAR
jgi:hypothetical protein